MSHAVVLGGTGVVGLAVARRLLNAGWTVDLTGRNAARMPGAVAAAGGRFLASDRHDAAQLAAVIGTGADLVVDCACYTADDARLLVPLLGDVRSTVMVSSKAVYVDADGNHVNSQVRPRFDGPVRETQPTMTPRSIDYRSPEGYGANKVAAEQVLLDSGSPVSVLRASKVHGAFAANPREWVFVKRILDDRPVVVLANRGDSIDHTTAAANLAALVETVAARPGGRILNSADPDAPTTLEIARAIATRLDHPWEEVLVDGTTIGQTPWDAPHPIVLDTSRSIELGYMPVGDYAATVAEAVDWMVSAAGADGDHRIPGIDDESFARYFDYVAEDAFLDSRRAR